MKSLRNGHLGCNASDFNTTFYAYSESHSSASCTGSEFAVGCCFRIWAGRILALKSPGF